MPLIEETTKTKVDIYPEILTEIEEEAQVTAPSSQVPNTALTPRFAGLVQLRLRNATTRNSVRN
ncbi:MAG: hypothetical protein ACJAXV_001457 [Bacteroidia bacterium]|jgi:hypothetical protein